MTIEYELYKGPQDGAKIKRIGAAMPQVVYVGNQWKNDGYAAWGRNQCTRFPCRYVMHGGKFVFDTTP